VVPRRRYAVLEEEPAILVSYGRVLRKDKPVTSNRQQQRADPAGELEDSAVFASAGEQREHQANNASPLLLELRQTQIRRGGTAMPRLK